VCQLHLSALPPDVDNYYDYFRWDYDCFDCVGLVCNSRPFDCVAVSLCVVMNTIDRHMMTAVVVGDDVCRLRFYAVV
jgi:hypothetical protein